MKQKTQQAEVVSPYTDLQGVSEIYADLVQNVHWDGSCFRIEFAVSRPVLATSEFDAANLKLRSYTSARIVVTPQVAVNLRELLNQSIANLEQQGVLKRLSPSSEQKQ